jgi:hypothetical protein
LDFRPDPGQRGSRIRHVIHSACRPEGLVNGHSNFQHHEEAILDFFRLLPLDRLAKKITRFIIPRKPELYEGLIVLGEGKSGHA